MIKYYPYAANDGKHKYYMVHLILQYIRMKKEDNAILKGIRIEKIGQNQD